MGALDGCGDPVASVEETVERAAWFREHVRETLNRVDRVGWRVQTAP